MKKIIIILGTIILGVFIVKDMIIGDSESLKASSESINTKCSNEIITIITNTDK